jgi:hypothetical protein
VSEVSEEETDEDGAPDWEQVGGAEDELCEQVSIGVLRKEIMR